MAGEETKIKVSVQVRIGLTEETFVTAATTDGNPYDIAESVLGSLQRTTGAWLEEGSQMYQASRRQEWP